MFVGLASVGQSCQETKMQVEFPIMCMLQQNEDSHRLDCLLRRVISLALFFHYLTAINRMSYPSVLQENLCENL